MPQIYKKGRRFRKIDRKIRKSVKSPSEEIHDLCIKENNHFMKETKIALGTWAWGAGMFGGDTVFGSTTDENNLKPVFDAAMGAGAHSASESRQGA